jgi:hypothetical protein
MTRDGGARPLRKRNSILPVRGTVRSMLRARAGPTAVVSEGIWDLWNATRVWHSTSCELNRD